MLYQEGRSDGLTGWLTWEGACVTSTKTPVPSPEPRGNVRISSAPNPPGQEDPWSSLVSSRPKASIPKNTWGHLVVLTRTHAHAKQKEPWHHQSKGAMVVECVPCLFLPFSYGNFLVCFLLLRSTATPKATWRRKESFGLSHSQSSSEDRAGTRDGNWIRGHGGHCLLACSAFLCKPVPITLGMTSFTVGLVPRHQLAIMKTPHKHSYTSVLHLIPDNQDEPSQGWN